LNRVRFPRWPRWLAACGCGFLLAACQKPGFHVLLGQLYEASQDCVDPTTSIDIVEGPDPGFQNMATCLVTPIGQNGGPLGVYVTTMAGPYPPLDDTSGSEPLCAKALAALARGAICSVTDAAVGSADDGGGDASTSASSDASLRQDSAPEKDSAPAD
jgi:hypothetical protein